MISIIQTEKIIGRKYELEMLEKAYGSKRAEFISVYGRRRVGKTYLIREFFTHKPCTYFQVTGIYEGKQEVQLETFTKELKRVFLPRVLKIEPIKNWMGAFEVLTEYLRQHDPSKKIIIFLDEFPWMAARKPVKLLRALEYYWNRFWVSMPNLKLVICGSASSWIIRRIIQSKGGIYNRTTLRLAIEPFSLAETKEFLEYEGIYYDPYQTLQLYTCLGGIPYYLTKLKSGISAMQNINDACFKKRGTLLDEFKVLFSSLFHHSRFYQELVEIIASKREGISREEIEKLVGYKGGRLTGRLTELEDIGFISSFTPWKREKKGLYYKVVDEYTLFYLTWISPKSKTRIKSSITGDYWEEISQTQAWKSWAVYAFEAVCFKHLGQIRKALHIPDGAEAYTWKYIPRKNARYKTGAQIDLVFDRADGIIHICEMKYSKSDFVLSKEEVNNLLNKIKVYREVTKTKKLIFVSLITTFGLKGATHSGNLVTSSATLDDLFKKGDE